MKEFTIYENNGKILRAGCCPESLLGIQCGEGELLTLGISYSNNEYVDVNLSPHSIIDRIYNPSTINGMQITNIPVPSKMYINGTQYDLDDSSIELDFTYPGEYKVQIVCFPYLDAIFKVVKS